MIIDSSLYNQPDPEYFRKRVPIDRISFDALASGDEAGIWIAGPKAWDTGKEDRFPIAIIWTVSSLKKAETQV